MQHVRNRSRRVRSVLKVAGHRPAGGGRVTQLRRLYFAQATDRGGRYGVRFEQVIEHLWQVRRVTGDLSISKVCHVSDLVFAAAACGNHAAAVRDFVEHFEQPVALRCWKRAPSRNPVVMARRLLAMLLRAPCEATGQPTLACYSGSVSLRRWLMAEVDRLIDADLRSPYEFTADSDELPAAGIESSVQV